MQGLPRDGVDPLRHLARDRDRPLLRLRLPPQPAAGPGASGLTRQGCRGAAAAAAPRVPSGGHPPAPDKPARPGGTPPRRRRRRRRATPRARPRSPGPAPRRRAGRRGAPTRRRSTPRARAATPWPYGGARLRAARTHARAPARTRRRRPFRPRAPRIPLRPLRQPARAYGRTRGCREGLGRHPGRFLAHAAVRRGVGQLRAGRRAFRGRDRRRERHPRGFGLRHVPGTLPGREDALVSPSGRPKSRAAPRRAVKRTWACGRAAGTGGASGVERASRSRLWSRSPNVGRGAQGVGGATGTGPGAGWRSVSGATTASSSAAAAAQVHAGSRRRRAGALDAAPSRATTREGNASK